MRAPDHASHLRPAVAFAHALPGGVIEVRTTDGVVLPASHDRAADADNGLVDLGVVVCLLSTDRPALLEQLDDVARWASAACYSQELLHAAQHTSETP